MKSMSNDDGNCINNNNNNNINRFLGFSLSPELNSNNNMDQQVSSHQTCPLTSSTPNSSFFTSPQFHLQNSNTQSYYYGGSQLDTSHHGLLSSHLPISLMPLKSDGSLCIPQGTPSSLSIYPSLFMLSYVIGTRSYPC